MQMVKTSSGDLYGAVKTDWAWWMCRKSVSIFSASSTQKRQPVISFILLDLSLTDLKILLPGRS